MGKDDFYWKGGWLYSLIPKGGGTLFYEGTTKGSTSVFQDAEGEGKMWARAFTVIVVSMGRNSKAE